MEDRVSRLIALLSEKEGALQELLQLLEEEQNCLLKHDVDLLQSQAEKKVDLYARLTNSARLSRQLIDQVAVEVGVPGANNLSFPDGQVPQGTWRTVLVTRTGQKVEVPFTLSPQPPGVPPALSGTVTVKVDPQNSLRFQVTGWVEDYLVWARDSQGLVMARVKNTGNWFTVPGGTSLVTLYSYDKARGIGLEAGPFPVQNLR